MTTTTMTKSSPAVAEPTIRGSSWKVFPVEPGGGRGRNQSQAGEGALLGSWGAGGSPVPVPTVLCSRLELGGEAVAAVPSHRACPHLHHVAGVGLQPVQPHRVLLAGDGVGNAIALTLLQGRHGGVTAVSWPPCCCSPSPDASQRGQGEGAAAVLYLLGVLDLIVENDAVGSLRGSPRQRHAVPRAAVQVHGGHGRWGWEKRERGMRLCRHRHPLSNAESRPTLPALSISAAPVSPPVPSSSPIPDQHGSCSDNPSQKAPKSFGTVSGRRCGLSALQPRR